LDIVREYNYLVESNFKTKHQVADYAEMLNKSPKTLSNLFKKYNEKSPLQVIQNRTILEARRLLHYSDKSIKEIAYEIGYEDIQSFSRFFKKMEGVSPSDFKRQYSSVFL
jgi:AraC family transcriptional activator of pobA